VSGAWYCLSVNEPGGLLLLLLLMLGISE